jgi:hypothetical protein
MIAGWRQWADAGSVSSGLPEYLLNHTRAARIGRIDPEGFYLFQIPGAHHLLRPVVKLSEGHRERMESHTNGFYLASVGQREFLLFVGDEPHRNEDAYAAAFLDAVQELGAQTVAVVAGVHGPVPHNVDRSVSCVYSLRHMKAYLARRAVRFSNYEGGATIGMYLTAKAAERGLELFRLCAYVPTYDFSIGSTLIQRMAMGDDYRAWYDLTRRLDRLFHLGLDLSDLARRSRQLTADWDARLEQLATKMPQLNVREYLQGIESEFAEEARDTGDDLWEDALRDILDDDSSTR